MFVCVYRHTYTYIWNIYGICFMFSEVLQSLPFPEPCLPQLALPPLRPSQSQLLTCPHSPPSRRSPSTSLPKPVLLFLQAEKQKNPS
jgi:hypothetical protein